MIWSDVISPDSIPRGSLQSKSERAKGVRNEDKDERGRVEDVPLTCEPAEWSQHPRSAEAGLRGGGHHMSGTQLCCSERAIGRASVNPFLCSFNGSWMEAFHIKT